MKNLIILDLETTGFDSKMDKIIEIGAVKVKNLEIEDEFSSLVNPNRKLTPEVERITGIESDNLKKAPEISEVIPELESFLEDFPIVAHNKDFDEKFLRESGISKTLHDTLELSCLLLPIEKKHTQEYLLEKHCQISYKNHRALSDAKNLYELFLFLRNRSIEMDERLKKELRDTLKGTSWSFKDLLFEKSGGNKDSYLTEKAEKKKFAPVLNKAENESLAMAHFLSFLFYSETGKLSEVSKWVRKRYSNFFSKVKVKRCNEDIFFNGNERLF